MVRNYDRTDVMPCYKKLSADRTRVKIYILSAVMYGVYVAGPDTFIASEDYPGVRKGEPTLQCGRQSARRTPRH